MVLLTLLLTNRHFDEQYGKVKVTAGNYNTQKLETMFNMPINENSAVRFAGYALKRDGYIDNLFLPDTHYDGTVIKVLVV